MSHHEQSYTEIAQARAERIKQFRRFLRLSRPAFSVLSGLPVDTLRNWEQARYGGLTEKGARKLAIVLQQQGIGCTVEWLLYGIGQDPIVASTPKHSNEDTIRQELDFFQQLHPKSLYHVVNDDGMLPCFLPGDYVAGQCYNEHKIEEILSLPCIVKTIEGNVLLRKIAKSEQNNYYHLSCVNLQTTIAQPIVNNVKLISIAPVLWLRRKS